MNRQRIRSAYENIRPNADARTRMLETILLEASEIPPAGKDETMKYRKIKPAVWAALIALAAAMTVTVFAAEEISGWFQQYFARRSENGLTAEQVAYLNDMEQCVQENQIHQGYDLKLKSVLSDNSTVYVTVGITAPSDITKDALTNLWGSDIDFYDENKKPCASWTMEVYDDPDGLENTVDLMFLMNPADWNSGDVWTLRIDTLKKLVHNEEYERELLETKYAGQENFMFTDEEAAKIHQQVILAEGPWEFTIDLSAAENEAMELITDPVAVQVRSGIKEDGTYVFDEVHITSVVVFPLSVTIQTDCDYAPDFTAGDRKIYAVMNDGSRIALLSNWGVGGKQHFSAESPIVLDSVDYILLGDGTKIPAP